MGLYYILRDTPPGTDGLDPANVLTMMDSLLTGAPIAGQSRVTISARSPLTRFDSSRPDHEQPFYSATNGFLRAG